MVLHLIVDAVTDSEGPEFLAPKKQRYFTKSQRGESGNWNDFSTARGQQDFENSIQLFSSV